MSYNKVYYAVEKPTVYDDDLKIFLAGTIDSSQSENWQKKICENVLDYNKNRKRVVIFNPRRDEWPKDSDHDEIYRQIQWELDRMDESDVIVMQILGDSKSPISLMEIGIHCHDNKLVVCCPEEFYRFDNVKMVCNRFNVPLYTDKTAEEVIDGILKNIS